MGHTLSRFIALPTQQHHSQTTSRMAVKAIAVLKGDSPVKGIVTFSQGQHHHLLRRPRQRRELKGCEQSPSRRPS